MAYRFGQYTQPLMLQKQLGQAASTGNILADLRARNLEKTKSEYSKDVKEQMRAKSQRAARSASSIGKTFGVLKTLANFIPGVGPALSAALSGIEADKTGKVFSKAGKGFGKYKGTFMGDATEEFAETQKEQAREFDPFKAFATDLVTGMVTGKAKHEVPVGGSNIEKMWKDMSMQERMGSVFAGGGQDDSILGGITRATTAFSPYLNRPKYTTNFYGS